MRCVWLRLMNPPIKGRRTPVIVVGYDIIIRLFVVTKSIFYKMDGCMGLFVMDDLSSIHGSEDSVL